MRPHPNVFACVITISLLAQGCRAESPPSPSGRTAETQAIKNPQGRWNLRPQPPAIGEADLIKQLAALGYLAGTETPGERSGITVHDPASASPGLNFYCSGHFPGAVLMDMSGNTVHKWEKRFDALWPGHPFATDNSNATFWRRAHLFENGDVIAIFEGLGMVKLDKDSTVIWKRFVKPHHDLEVLESGAFWMLTRKLQILKAKKDAPMVEDFATLFDRDGRRRKSVSFIKAFERSPAFASLYHNRRIAIGDVLHVNTLHLLDDRIAKKLPAFKKGNILFSARDIDTIGVLDPEQEKVVWAMQGPFKGQHDPKVIANGNILLFNNYKTDHRSSVMEIDPVTRKTVWEYDGDDAAPLFSSTCGSAYRLPNGNTLIVESNKGRAVEISPTRRIVWEFLSPHRAGKSNTFVASLFDLVRLFPQGVRPWM